MFTDGPVTPLHLETLIEVFRGLRSRHLAREAVYGVLQPKGVANSQEQSKTAIRAAIELGLVTEKEGSEVALTEAAKGRRPVRQCVLDALDEVVLSGTDVEYYFAMFYSYMLGLDNDTGKRTRDEWVAAFNRDVFDNQRQSNPFNVEKWTGLHRWFVYAGLGWNDPGDVFQCNPYERVNRSLPRIFHDGGKYDDDTFMDRVADVCPELDGGTIFKRANPNRLDARVCTAGLAHALIDLHLDRRIRLHCSPDSGGWSLKMASPPTDGKTLLSDRMDFIEIRKGAK